MDKKNFGQKIFYSPLTKIIIASVTFVCILMIGAIIKNSLGFNRNLSYLIFGIIVPTLVVVSFSWLYKVFEKRKFTDFSTDGIGKNLMIGLILGTFLCSSLFLLVYLRDGYDTVISVNSVVFIIPPLAGALTASILEETVFRGFIFRIVEEKLGSYLALLISALIFAVIHLPFQIQNSAGLSIATTLGVLFAIAYIYSRNLWFPIAIHFAWDLTATYILGITSHSHTRLISFRSEWFANGGTLTQPEAYFCIFAAIIILLILCHKKRKIVKPYWNKNNK